MKGLVDNMSVARDKDKIFVSIDLCRDYSQITYCYSDKMTEPESVSTIPGEQKYLIPTVVGKINDIDEWIIGDEALLRNSREEAQISKDIVNAILAERNTEISGKGYSGYDILKVFIVGLLKLLKTNHHIEKPDYLVVTVEYPDRLLVNVIRSVLEDIGLEKENIKVLGHSESLIYYMIFQKKELWVNDVFIFDFTEHQFQVRRLNSVKSRLPQPIIVEEMDLSSKYDISMTDTEEGKARLDRQFFDFLQDICSKHIVSTVYLTGVGFYKEWMKESIRFLCSKRRVFQGYNLFVKGACFGAISESGIGNAGDYQFVCSGRTLVNIDLEVVKDDKIIPVSLSKAGTNWYEAGARAEGILDASREIRLRINSSISKNSKIVTINLMSFPPRPNKTTRIEIILSYRNDRQCIVIVKDLGFGEFFKSSGDTVKEVLNIEEFI